MKVLGCGALNLDLIFEVEDLEGIRQQGWPLFPGREISGTHEEAAALAAFLKTRGRLLAESGGGSAANTICCLSALGHNCSFLGLVGNDPQGDAILESMKGVDISCIERKGRTAVCIVVLEKKGRDRAMFVAPASFLPEKKVIMAKNRFNHFDLIHFSSLLQEEGVSFQADLAGMQGPDQLVSLDPGELYAARGLKELMPLLKESSLLFVTSSEVEMLTGLSLVEGIQSILNQMHGKSSLSRHFNAMDEAGGGLVVCKKGPEGASAAALNGRVFHQPAKRIESVLDNTGAGDAFNAGFLDGVSRGAHIQACLEAAAEMAAISLTTFGREYLATLNKH